MAYRIVSGRVNGLQEYMWRRSWQKMVQPDSDIMQIYDSFVIDKDMVHTYVENRDRYMLS